MSTSIIDFATLVQSNENIVKAGLLSQDEPILNYTNMSAKGSQHSRRRLKQV